MADTRAELKAMQGASTALESLEPDEQRRVVVWLIDSLGIKGVSVPSIGTEGAAGAAGAEQDPSKVNQGIKAFVQSKQPKTVGERIACLAYHLLKVDGVTQFKSPQITTANTAAAQPRIANISRDLSESERGRHYLASAGKGFKQISPRGEALVEALPDRDAVKTALAAHPVKRRKKAAGTKKAAATKKTTVTKKASGAKRLPRA
jgi:hypothetical protein